MFIGALASKIQAKGLRSVAKAFGQATFGATGFQMALDALGIGLILLAITGLIAGLIYLYHHCRKFREILGYIGGAGKAVFHNIGIYIERVWRMVIKPAALFIWNIFKSTFLGIWETVKMVWNGISTAVSLTWNSVIKPIALFIFNIYKMVFMKIWSVVKWVFGMIKDFALGVWNFIKNIFSGLFSWLQTAIINPIKNIFSGLWDWIVGLLDKIFSKLDGILKPIRDLWNSIFSSEGTVNVHQAGMKGAKKEGEKFDQEQKEKKEKEEKGNGKPQEVKVINSTNDKPIFDVSKGNVSAPPTLGGVAAESAKKKNKKGHGAHEGGTQGENGNKVRNLTVGKMVENLNIYTQRGGISESKEQLIQAIKEIFATAVTDFAGMDKNATAS